MADLIGNAAPNAQTELARLEAELPLGTSRQPAFRNRLRRSLEGLDRRAVGQPAASRGAPIEGDEGEASPLERLTPSQARDLRRAINRDLASGESSLEPAGASGSLESMNADQRADLLLDKIDAYERALAAPPTEPTLEPSGAISDFFGAAVRNIRWARVLLDWRWEILRRYRDLYRDVALMTPALVDYDYWLRGSAPDRRSTMEDQIKVMAALSRKSGRTGGPALHGFVAFDPLRAVMEKHAGDRTPLELADWAVMEMGFIGVKLYPPMGFTPLGNQFNAFDKDIRGDLSSSALGRALNEKLHELYRWASENQVPILTHAAESFGARRRYELRARPDGWEAALQAYPNLKIILAHMGDFQHKPLSEAIWEADAGTLMDRYDGVHMDLSFLDAALKSTERRAAAAALRRFIAADSNRVRKLAFGTDWLLTGRSAGHAGYIPGMVDYLERAGLDLEARRNVFRRNAVRLLGLAPGQPGRDRLNAFYHKNEMDISRIDSLIEA